MYNYPMSQRCSTDGTQASTPQENEPRHSGYASIQERSLSLNVLADSDMRDGANGVFGNGYMGGGGRGYDRDSGVYSQENALREVHVSTNCNKIMT
jgi:hypothetical protein